MYKKAILHFLNSDYEMQNDMYEITDFLIAIPTEQKLQLGNPMPFVPMDRFFAFPK